MHRSRVHAVIIDTPTQEAARATEFWSATLGVPARPLPDQPQFTSLRGAVPGLVTAVQAVDGAPGIHIDIESDDPDAETSRLLALGAEQIGRWLECRILRVPGAHVVCVLPVESDPELFDAQATTWP